MKEQNERVGFLTWFSVPDVSAPYEDLAELAGQVGFPADCVPTPPLPRHAWEKATGTGRRGIDVTPPEHLAERIEAQYGVKPKVRLVTRTINGKAPQLVRHLVREAVISKANSPRKQLDMGTVAVLKFDTNRNQSDLLVVPDPSGYINGDVRAVVQEMDRRIAHLMSHAVSDEVRYGIRKMLERLHRTSLRGSGGVYFVPATVPEAAEQMRAMRDYIRGLKRWRVGEAPSCDVVTLRGSEAYDEVRDTVTQSVLEEFEGRLEELVGKVEPVLAGRARGKVAERINQQAMEALLETKSGLAIYRESLGDRLQALDDILTMAQAAVVKASGLG